MGDQSTVGESQMSVADSQMSSMGTESAAGGGEEGNNQKFLLLCLCFLLAIGIGAGVYFSGGLGSGTEGNTDETDEAGLSGSDSGVQSSVFPSPMTTKTSRVQSTGSTNESTLDAMSTMTLQPMSPEPMSLKPTPAKPTPAKPTTAKPTTTKPTPPKPTPPTLPPRVNRTGMLVCIVGSRFYSSVSNMGDHCSYTIYPDLSIEGTNVVGTYGYSSWDKFKKFLSTTKTATVPGGGFLAAHMGDKDSPITTSSLTATLLKTLTDAPLKMRALGFLGIEFPKMTLAPFKNHYKMFKRALSNMNHAMTFMSVVITTEKDGKDFVDGIASFSDLDTVILETHITIINKYTVNRRCFAHYMAYKFGDDLTLVPTFKIADKTVDYFRNKTNKFRVMYSSSSGAMLYIGDTAMGPSQHGCDKSILMDPSILCQDFGTPLYFKVDQKEAATYATWERNKRHHFVTIMDNSTIGKWMGEYIVDRSEGWALFNSELDFRYKCTLSDRVASLHAISTIARSRKYTG